MISEGLVTGSTIRHQEEIQVAVTISSDKGSSVMFQDSLIPKEKSSDSKLRPEYISIGAPKRHAQPFVII